MMAITYLIENVEVTGSRRNPQTIYYATLKDTKNRTLPVQFLSKPAIGITKKRQDRGAYIVSRDTDHFKVALKIFGKRDCEHYYFNFLIRGES